MTLLSTVMNHAANLTHSESFFSRNITSRFLTVGICPVLESMEVAAKVIQLPFQAVGAVVKTPVAIINLAIGSKTMREFVGQLPGPLDLIRTALKIVGLTLGTIFTLTFGLLSPMTNFKLHHALGLVRDEKAEAQLLARKLEAQKKKEAYERMLEEQLSRITDALRLKIMEAVPPPSIEEVPPIVEALDAPVEETLPVEDEAYPIEAEDQPIAEEIPVPTPAAEGEEEILEEAV